ncbi:MAG: flippase [Methanosphaera sp.]|uniref:flippase n=1 Tax=Methanosphaera sp. TaxID=2666342 RepID=UPI0025EEF369|nr:flippase [Methanosphaera sp.]MCI5867694.1 flippase [Methanosphaera sp.]MDD6534162.1 flippase [Methanosphaera sp.]MDY3956029.1 flippase [Methanosphaera sp.]
MNAIRRVVKNIGSLFLSRMIGYVLAFVYTLYSARYLGTADFGLISFATAITGLFSIFTDLGLSTLTIREVARDKSQTAKYMGNHGSIKLILSILTMLMLVVYVNFGFNEITKYVVYIIGLSVITDAFGGTFTSIFGAYEQMEYQSLAEIINSVVMCIGVLICVFTNQGVIGVAMVYLISSAVVLVYNFILCSRNYGVIHFQFDFKFWKYLIKTAFPLAITSIFALISFKMNTIMLNYLTTSSVVGEYTAAFNLMQALIFIPTVYSTAILPLFSKLFIDRQDMLAYSYKKSLKYLSLLSIPIAMGTTLLADKIVLFMYGASYANTIPILRLIIWALPAIFLSYVLGTSITSINKQHETLRATFLCLILSLVGNYIFINLFSGEGAAFVTILNEVSMVIFYIYIMHKYGYSVPVKTVLIKPFVASVVMAIVISILNLELFSSIFIGATVYTIMILLLKTIDEDDIKIVGQILPERIVKYLEKIV